ncbi:MAG: hypothetical protein MHM6MM_007554, partial [Cercozoa sp. M6MM]
MAFNYNEHRDRKFFEEGQTSAYAQVRYEQQLNSQESVVRSWSRRLLLAAFLQLAYAVTLMFTPLWYTNFGNLLLPPFALLGARKRRSDFVVVSGLLCVVAFLENIGKLFLLFNGVGGIGTAMQVCRSVSSFSVSSFSVSSFSFSCFSFFCGFVCRVTRLCVCVCVCVCVC